MSKRTLPWLALTFFTIITSLPFDGLAAPGGKRLKVIDFEEELIEGVNKRPLDQLNSLSDRERRRRRTHLYKKRGGFRTETAATLREMGYSQ